MRAMILAAGLGTRLRPLTAKRPKPLLPVVGVPNIVRSIRHLVRAGIREIVVNSHHLPEVLEAALGDGAAFGAAIAFSREAVLLGTGGGIRRALPLLGDGTFVVVNGDALFAPDIRCAVEAHRDTGALATLVLRADPEAETLGAVGLDGHGRIRRLVFAKDAAAAERTYMFTGVHVLEPEIGGALPENGCIVRETYIPLLAEGARLFGLPEEGYFCDLGTPARYLAANVELVTGSARLPGIDPPPGGVYLGAGAVVGRGADLRPGTVICDGAKVAPGVRLERAVVLEGAVARCDAEDAVVMEDGVVVPAQGTKR